ncbi:PLC-like phosphodiesterase [Russula earlei]|uniref:PLC-like phosphodiesterase n=1 Tax=Russula earlei TaxID=71964 RepID=A0ACC0UKI7_9AGAM|nr:PLC-like phosphodiesterase [Russula earlei]
MECHLFNLTDKPFLVKPESLGNEVELVVLPNDFATLPAGGNNFTLSSAGGRSEVALEKAGLELDVERRYVNLKKSPRFRWNNVSMPEDCPWRIYRDQSSGKRVDILVLPKRALESFLSDLPDKTPLYSLCLPGTHDTVAFYGWPITQCQSATTPLFVQLTNGIRVLDIRLAIKNRRLVAYHGQIPQRTTFRSILCDLHAFLTSPTSARETVIVSIKQEDFDTRSPKVFSGLVREEIEAGPGGRDMWFLQNRIPNLGEVRGKAIMFSRFGGDGAEWEGGLEGMGIHPTNWPDSAREGFTWMCKDVLVRTQDWYRIPSFLYIPEKTQLSVEFLLPPPADITERVLSITYFSASSFPLATPTIVSTGFGWPSVGLGFEGVNSRVARFLLDAIKEDVMLRAWVLMDFYDQPVGSGVVPLLIECNFRERPGDAHGAIAPDRTHKLNWSQTTKIMS